MSAPLLLFLFLFIQRISLANSPNCIVSAMNAIYQPGNGKKCALNLGNDTLVCGSNSYRINASIDFDFYQWSTGELSNSIEVSSSGKYSVLAGKLGSNLVSNGEFSEGNIGFTSEYQYESFAGSGMAMNPNKYDVSSVLNSSSNFSTCTLPRIGGNFLIAMESKGGQKTIWKQKIKVHKKTDYYFSFWVSNRKNGRINTDFGVYINGVKIATESAISVANCSWVRLSGIWNSGKTKEIELEIKLMGQDENIVVIDNISFAQVKLYRDEQEVILDPIYVNAGPDLTSCSNDPEVITALCNDPAATFLWNTGSTEASITPETTGIYILDVTSSNGCKSRDSVYVFVSEVNWHISKVTSAPTFCNESHGMVAVETKGDFDDFPYFTWSGPGMYNSNYSNSQAWHGLEAGIYYVTVRSGSCYHFDSVTVTNEGGPVASFVVEKGEKQSLRISFKNTTINGTTFIWDFGNGKTVETSDAGIVSMTYAKPGEYLVKLTAKRPGCTDSVKSLKVKVGGKN